MSTSEADHANPVTADAVAQLPSAIPGLPADLPDPGVLARLANEFFKDVPGVMAAEPALAPAALPKGPEPLPPTNLVGSLPATQGAPQHALPAIPAGSSSALPLGMPGFSFLDELRPRFPEPSADLTFGAPGSLRPDAVPTINMAGMPPQTAPAFHAAASPVFGTSVPGLSFLDEIRPRFPEARLDPVLLNAFLKAPAADLPAVPGPDTAPDQMQPVPTPPMPTLPGSFDFLSLPTFSFMEEARLLFSSPPATPAPLPHTNHAQPEPPPFKLSSDLFDVQTVRRDFPILKEQVNGQPLVWLDNAATTQKPQSVIDRLSYFYAHENSNVHRAAHELAARATDAYESAREKTRRFLNASAVREIIFVRGATEGINLVAQSWGRRNVEKDDEIVITWLEHHANIVPWQMLCSEKQARLRVAPVDDRGQVILEEYEKLLGPRTRLVSLTQVSNALGIVTPLPEMIAAAHRHGAKVLVDGAQAVSHMRVDVQALNCDFYVFSGHKVFAPTGIGVVFGKSEVLDDMPPWQGGGNMIADVTFEKTTYQPPPVRFEAGTGNIADAVGLGAAIDYVERIGMDKIARYEHELLVYATSRLAEVPGLRMIGTAAEKAAVLSFVLDGVRTEEVGGLLNREGIAVRSGHHCAQPILRRFGVESTVRASLALYNTCEDIAALIAALKRIQAARRVPKD